MKKVVLPDIFNKNNNQEKKIINSGKLNNKLIDRLGECCVDPRSIKQFRRTQQTNNSQSQALFSAAELLCRIHKEFQCYDLVNYCLTKLLCHPEEAPNFIIASEQLVEKISTTNYIWALKLLCNHLELCPSLAPLIIQCYGPSPGVKSAWLSQQRSSLPTIAYAMRYFEEKGVSNELGFDKYLAALCQCPTTMRQDQHAAHGMFALYSADPSKALLDKYLYLFNEMGPLLFKNIGSIPEALAWLHINPHCHSLCDNFLPFLKDNYHHAYRIARAITFFYDYDPSGGVCDRYLQKILKYTETDQLAEAIITLIKVDPSKTLLKEQLPILTSGPIRKSAAGYASLVSLCYQHGFLNKLLQHKIMQSCEHAVSTVELMQTLEGARILNEENATRILDESVIDCRHNPHRRSLSDIKSLAKKLHEELARTTPKKSQEIFENMMNQTALPEPLLPQPLLRFSSSENPVLNHRPFSYRNK